MLKKCKVVYCPVVTDFLPKTDLDLAVFPTFINPPTKSTDLHFPIGAYLTLENDFKDDNNDDDDDDGDKDYDDDDDDDDDVDNRNQLKLVVFGINEINLC